MDFSEYLLKIPKKEVVVELLSDASESDFKRYSLYINMQSPLHSGEETIDEYLNSEVLFLPANENDTNKFVILNKHHILIIKTDSPTEITTNKTLTIALQNNSNYIVAINTPLPAFHSRPVDFMNSAQTFLQFSENGRVIFFNKNKILFLTENE
jgi:hypothetical protein